MKNFGLCRRSIATLLAVLLAVCLVTTLGLSALPATALAEDTESGLAEQVQIQAVTAGWIKNYGGSSSDCFYSVIATTDGGYVAVGKSTPSNGDRPGNKGQGDFVIAKFDANGNKTWIKNYGGIDYDYFCSVIATTDGGYVAVGGSSSSDGDLPGNNGSYDLVVAKFDANGNKMWIKNYGGSNSDEFYSVIATTDGGYMAVGSSTSSDGDLPGNNGFGGFIVAKFDANGNEMWIKNYGGSSSEAFYSVIATTDGGYVAVGDSYSSDGDLSGNKGDSDFVIAKFDANGNKTWIKNYGGSGTDYFYSVIATTDGGYVAVGDSSSSDGDLPGNNGYYDSIIAKFDANGNLPTTTSTPTLNRISGPDRHQTAVAASKAAFPDESKVDAVIVASASGFPDALAASTLAGTSKCPILLSPKDKLDDATKGELNRLKPATVYITGGTASINAATETEIKGLSFKPKVTRLGGADRFATGKLIADQALGKDTAIDEVFLVSGDNFPDALAVSPFSVITKTPIVLTAKGTLSGAAKDFITNHKVKTVIIIGGTASVSQSIQNYLINSLHLKVERLYGADRYETAHKLTTELMSRYNIKPDVIGVATGDAFPDALSGGASLGARGGILVLTSSKSVGTHTEAQLKTHVDNKPAIEILGGNASVHPDVEKTIKSMFSIK